MRTINVSVPTNAAEQAELDAQVVRENDQRARESLAKANRDAGKAEPKAGGSLFVRTVRGISARGRAGLLFGPTSVEVKIIEGTDEEIAAKVRAGAYVVNAWGAEQILNDTDRHPHSGLEVTARAGETELADSLSLEALEAAIARKRAAPRADSPERIASSRKAQEHPPHSHDKPTR